MGVIKRFRTGRPLAAAAAGLCLAAAGALGGLAMRHGARADLVEASACTAEVDKWAAPTVLELGQTTRVTLTLKSACPQEKAPIDVMMVLDVSASMGDNDKIRRAREAGIAFVAAMTNTSRVGLVKFNQDAGVAVPLTFDRSRVAVGLDVEITSGKTNVSQAIDVARAHIVAEARPGVKTAMIVLTDGKNTVPADPIPVAAQRAKDAGIVVVTVCAGGQCDPDLLPAASEPSYYFNVPNPADLEALFVTLATELQKNAVVSLTVYDIVPSNMRYIDGSSVPPAVVSTETGSLRTVLTWQFPGDIPEPGLSYLLEPQEPGEHPTNVIAEGIFFDRKGLRGSEFFPVPRVIVPGGCPRRPLEVYFLVDDSTCLLGASLSGLDSKEAIAQGVSRVLDMMDMGQDTAAVIGFGSIATLYQPLTHDKAAIVDGVRRVAMQDQAARLDLGFQEVRRELSSARSRPETTKITVSVTDGPMMPAPNRAIEHAKNLRSRGFHHYAIGIGPIVQHGVLRKVAEPGGYRAIALGGDVITMYVELGGNFTPLANVCPPTPGAPTLTPVLPTVPPTVPVPPTDPPPPPLPVVRRFIPWAERR
ncbi:MAG: VWA domain-containing protein [Ardenticatenales bacterium]|nr:VWA domain-containing protein [Ardenticatenales bacterium]